MGKSVIHDDIPVELDDGIDEELLDVAPDADERSDLGIDPKKILAEELAAGEEVEA